MVVWFIKLIVHCHFLYSWHVVILINLWLKVKEQGKKQLFFRVHHLLIKAKTLNLWEIYIGFFRSNVISGESHNCPFLFVSQTIENDCCFWSPNNNFFFDWLKLPIDPRLRETLEFYKILFMIDDCVKCWVLCLSLKS